MSPEQFALIHEFHDYYLLAGTAAATLLGLLFIAVTLNADLILAGTRPHVKRLAEQAFQNYIVVLIAAMFLLLAELPARVLATTLLLLATVMGGWTLFRVAASVRVADESFGRTRVWRRLWPSLAGYGLMVLGAIKTLHGFEREPVQYFSSALLILLIAATAIAWELLVRVAEIRHSSPRP
jgi:hypothetical protein